MFASLEVQSLFTFQIPIKTFHSSNSVNTKYRPLLKDTFPYHWLTWKQSGVTTPMTKIKQNANLANGIYRPVYIQNIKILAQMQGYKSWSLS